MYIYIHMYICIYVDDKGVISKRNDGVVASSVRWQKSGCVSGWQPHRKAHGKQHEWLMAEGIHFVMADFIGYPLVN